MLKRQEVIRLVWLALSEDEQEEVKANNTQCDEKPQLKAHNNLEIL